MSTALNRSAPQAVMSMGLRPATADTPRGRRLCDLLNEVNDIEIDLALARRYDPTTSAAWLAELLVERQDVWAHIVETITT